MNIPNRPLVSIGIPTYNRAGSFLAEALQAALNQTYSNIEIIVSDNCSEDHTEDLVNAISDPRIRYFKQKQNIGSFRNNNFCLQQAKGEYFHLLHDDDFIDPDFLETCLLAVRENPNAGVIRTGLRLINDRGQIHCLRPNDADGLSLEEFILSWFRGKTWFCFPNTLFHTNKLRETGGFHFEHDLFIDVVALMRLSAQFGRVDVREIKASFRRHAGELTYSAKMLHWCQDSLVLLDFFVGLAVRQKDQIRREGMKFLVGRNYNLAGHYRAWSDRMSAYLMIYKFFHYQYSPISYFVGRTLFVRRMRWTLQRMWNCCRCIVPKGPLSSEANDYEEGNRATYKL